jgi:hypothetical protein
MDVDSSDDDLRYIIDPAAAAVDEELRREAEIDAIVRMRDDDDDDELAVAAAAVKPVPSLAELPLFQFSQPLSSSSSLSQSTTADTNEALLAQYGFDIGSGSSSSSGGAATTPLTQEELDKFEQMYQASNGFAANGKTLFARSQQCVARTQHRVEVPLLATLALERSQLLPEDRVGALAAAGNDEFIYRYALYALPKAAAMLLYDSYRYDAGASTREWSLPVVASGERFTRGGFAVHGFERPCDAFYVYPPQPQQQTSASTTPFEQLYGPPRAVFGGDPPRPPDGAEDSGYAQAESARYTRVHASKERNCPGYVAQTRTVGVQLEQLLPDNWVTPLTPALWRYSSRSEDWFPRRRQRQALAQDWLATTDPLRWSAQHHHPGTLPAQAFTRSEFIAVLRPAEYSAYGVMKLLRCRREQVAGRNLFEQRHERHWHAVDARTRRDAEALPLSAALYAFMRRYGVLLSPYSSSSSAVAADGSTSGIGYLPAERWLPAIMGVQRYAVQRHLSMLHNFYRGHRRRFTYADWEAQWQPFGHLIYD